MTDLDPATYLTVIAVLLAIVVALVTALVLVAHARRGGTAANPDPDRRRSVSIMVGMALVSLAFIGVIVGVGMPGDGNQTLALPLLLIAGVVIFLGALAALVLLFVRNGLSNRNYALGLPDGSIRAIIALSLILLVAILAVFLYIGQGGLGTDAQPTVAQTDLAKQLVTTMSTLVVAIASFYFGSTTVREAKKPEGEKPGAPQPVASGPMP
jgi:amino acid transporter